MIKRARAKYPQARFFVQRIQDDLPVSFPERYDCITSAYAFHHFGLDEKVRVIQHLTLKRLVPGGRLLIADVAFPTVKERETARCSLEDRWDPDEYYWAADETKELLQGLSLDVNYFQVSFCGGIFVIRQVSGANEDG